MKRYTHSTAQVNSYVRRVERFEIDLRGIALDDPRYVGDSTINDAEFFILTADGRTHKLPVRTEWFIPRPEEKAAWEESNAYK